MKLKIRTLSNMEAVVEVEEDMLLSEVKKKVQEAMPNFSSTNQILIHQGKILNDSMTIREYPTIKDGDKLIVMMPKAKAKPSNSTAVDASVSQSSQPASSLPSAGTAAGSGPASTATTPTPSYSSTPHVPSTTPVPAASSVTDSPTGSAQINDQAAADQATVGSEVSGPGAAGESAGPQESAFVLGRQYEETINNIVAMGFEKTKVIQAMHAAFNNPDRAVEYLTTGIPPAAAAPSPPPSTESAAAVGPAGAAVGPAGAAVGPAVTAGSPVPAGSAGPLDSLRQHPSFEQFRLALQANPQLLPTLLHAIHQQDPNMAQQIINNPVAFQQLLSEGGSGGQQGIRDAGRTSAGAAAGQPGTVSIQVTPEQNEKVRHLQALGFSQEASVQALIVCEWDEDRAANFLFDDLADFPDSGDFGDPLEEDEDEEDEGGTGGASV